jgi:hypothetical protein
MSNDLGIDRSGNGNNWTVNNLAYSDQMLDSPTNNFATLSVTEGSNGEVTFSEGNLQIYRASVGSPFPGGQSNMSTGTSGKWYWEVYLVSTTNNYERIGIVTEDHPASTYLTDDTYGGKGWGWEYSGNKTSTDNGDETYGSNPTFATGEIVGVAVDVDNGTLTFYQDNVSRGVAFTGLTSQAPFRARNDSYNTSKHFYNFGQDSSFGGNKTAQGNQDGNGIGDFYYTPPTGFLALCTSNLPDVDVVPSEHFNTVAYTGDGTTDNDITGVGFQPDFVWIKNLPRTESHNLFDSVRGPLMQLYSNNTNAEYEHSTTLTSFDSNGFSLSSENSVNRDTEGYISWNWKAATTYTPTVTSGLTSASGRSNADAGFSIVKVTADASIDNNSSYTHNLGVAPEMIITKITNSTGGWNTYHKDLGGAGKYIELNTTTAVQDATNVFETTPTSTIVKPGSNIIANGQTLIFYNFASVDGYSKVGSYTGNGNADGTFIYTGFRPRFILTKPSSYAHNWTIIDTERDTYNPVENFLHPNLTNAEIDLPWIDIVSNGFKFRNTHVSINGSYTYIYMAFAETPFKYSNAR